MGEGNNNGFDIKKLLLFSAPIGCATTFLIFFPLFVVVLFVLGLFEGGSGTGGSLVYESECNYEETKVIVMDGSNTKVLATVSLEDYVIGVSCPEIGACDGASSSLDEHYVKTQYIAAKTYSLARGNYNSADKTITVKASTRDQQWCDLENGCIVTKTNDLIPGYSDQYFYNTYPGNYNTSQIDGSIQQRRSFTEKDLEIFHKYYKDIYGELFLSDSYDSKITSLSWSDATEFKASTQNHWKAEAASGKTYEEILDDMGSSGVTDSEDYKGKSIYKLGTYCKATRVGNGGNLVDLGEYPDVSSTKELNAKITTLLSKKEIDNLNSYIESNIKKAGYGTGEAVAAAAQSLIYGLYQYDYHLPYWYGGGHSLGITDGVDEKWGSKGSNTDSSWTSYNSGKGRTVYSYDCSGFVSWAIKNACKSNFGVDYTGGFIKNYGSSIKLSDSKPGDLMVIHQQGGSQHVRMIVKNNGDGSVIAAESTAGNIKHGGIQFIKYKSAGGYTIIDMSKWYKNNCD